jgi:hypothetical protein
MSIEKHLIHETATVYEALARLNEQKTDLNLFVMTSGEVLCGSVTDGDIRRGILKGVQLDDSISKIMNRNFKYIRENSIDLALIAGIRKAGIKILPIVNNDHRIVDLLHFNRNYTILPCDAVMMAGGIGSRLLPLTQSTPKPLLHIGGKPIIHYNLERLRRYGVNNIFVTVNYLKEKIISFLQCGI